MSHPATLLAICMMTMMISSVVSTTTGQNTTAFVTGDPSPAIAKLLECKPGKQQRSFHCDSDGTADFASQKLLCPTCNDFGKSNLDGLRLEETCSPANDPLDIPSTTNIFSEVRCQLFFF